MHGCELLPPEKEEKRADVRALSAAEVQIVDADNAFGLNLFRAVSEDEGSKNVFISPLSVSRALGMTLNGANGETYTAMQETLELHGLSRLIRPADLTGISGNGDLYISAVKHKTFVEVDKEGTEAAAVTSVVVNTTSVGGGAPTPVHLDRPFLFFIREHHSGTILFVGKIAGL